MVQSAEPDVLGPPITAEDPRRRFADDLLVRPDHVQLAVILGQVLELRNDLVCKCIGLI